MDIVTVITVTAAIMGIVAGFVQVLDYFQKGRGRGISHQYQPQTQPQSRRASLYHLVWLVWPYLAVVVILIIAVTWKPTIGDKMDPDYFSPSGSWSKHVLMNVYNFTFEITSINPVGFGAHHSVGLYKPIPDSFGISFAGHPPLGAPNSSNLSHLYIGIVSNGQSRAYTNVGFFLQNTNMPAGGSIQNLTVDVDASDRGHNSFYLEVRKGKGTLTVNNKSLNSFDWPLGIVDSMQLTGRADAEFEGIKITSLDR